MNHIKQITPITIRDIEFTVSRQIEQCPKTMMLRELVMNAVEAAGKAPAGRLISAELRPGVRPGSSDSSLQATAVPHPQ